MADYKSNLSQIIKNDIENCEIIKFNSEENHSINLLRNLNAQLNGNLYCDLDLVSNIDGTKFSVHRNIMAGSSRYFNAMFSSGMQESRMPQITLEDVDGETLKLLINFCYSGNIEIGPKNIEGLLAAASRYEFVEIEKQCSEFLEFLLKKNPLNCLSYYFLAHVYNFNGLKKQCKRLLCQYFMELNGTAEFLLLHFEQLCELIKCDDLYVNREEGVFNAVMMWINHDKSEREKYKEDLFKLIRLPQMDGTFLVNKMEEFNSTPLLVQIYKDVLNHKLSGGFLTFKYVNMTKPRKFYESNVLKKKRLDTLRRILEERIRSFERAKNVQL